MNPARKPEDGSKVEAFRLMRWLVVPVLGLLAVLSYLQYVQRLEDAQRELMRHAQEHAQELEAIARPAEAHVHDLRRLLERNWHDPPHSGPTLRSQMRPFAAAARAPTRSDGGTATAEGGSAAVVSTRVNPATPAARDTGVDVDGWTLDEAPETMRREQGQIWWAPVDRTPPTTLWLDRAAMFLRTARVVHERTPGFQGSYFVAAEANISWGYPWIDTPTMLKAMGVPTLQALEPLRVMGVQRTLRMLQNAHGKVTYWGEPYAGQLDGDLVQSHGAVLLIDGEYMGEVSVDFRISSLQQLSTEWQGSLNRSRVWVVDGSALVIADSAQPLKASDFPRKVNEAIRIRLDGRVPVEAADALAEVLPSKPAGTFVERGGWMLITAARAQSPWTFVQAVPMSTMRAQVLPTLLPNALLAVALIAVLLAGQWLFARWFVTPALAVLAYLRQLSADPATPKPDLGPRWEGWVRAITKVFERQRHAQLLLEQQRETLRQNEKLSVMGTLLAGVAHELNNPLAIVMGRASLMEERIAPAAADAATGESAPDLREAREDARRIRAAAERCGRIVHTFLNMARQRPAARAPLQLDAVVQAGLDMLGYSLRSHGIQVERRLADALPDVQADADQLGQVVLNLIVNAQQALDAVNGTRRLVISTGHAEANRADWRHLDRPYVWLRVADNGPGVPKAQREQLFEPFFTTKAAGQGTGLGLSMSRAIAREHGGDLVLESTTEGASFCLMLPVADDPATDATALPEPTVAPEPDAARVLIVDDEPELVELMRITLELAGYEVASAESGAVALELLDAARFDAIVSDMRMPDLDGRALWRMLRQRHPTLVRRLLYVTGDTLSPDARTLLSETGCPSLDKPFEREALVRAVRNLLRNG